MIYIGLVIFIVSLIALFYVRTNYPYGPLHIICFGFFLIGLGCFSVSLISNVIDDPRIFDYKSTISTDEFNIDKYNEVKSAIDENNVKVSYTYKIKNTDNTKTVSTENGNVYSISVLNSSNRVNHLTVKHNTYLNLATFTTTQKDDYIFSSK